MSKLIIESMSEKHLDSVLKIERSSFRHPWGRSSFSNELSSKYSHNFVLKLENFFETYQIIAYLIYRLISDEIHILKIAVNPSNRREGIAFKLITHCLAAIPSQNARSAFLEVRQSNRGGMGLYKKIGFAIEAQIPNYYSDTREDAILMRKNILKEE